MIEPAAPRTRDPATTRRLLIVDDDVEQRGPWDARVSASRWCTTAPPARGRRASRRSALDNVVRNAVRHTAAGTAVEIEVARDGGRARVEVRDHGPGVPQDQLERIFDPFHRVAGTARPGGTGLGLAIARRILAQHGGEIRAARADGGGLSVTLQLPVA